MNYGDFPIEETIHVFFTTRAFATGIPGTLSAATVAVYEDITATPIETGVAVTESLNSIVGLNAVPIVAIAASGYEVGKNYHVVIEAGEVDSVSVIGEVVAYFSIGRSAAAVDLANGTDGLGAIKGETASIFAGTVTNAQGADVATDVAAMIDGNNRVDVGSFLGTAVAAATASGEVNANVTELGGVVQSLTDLKDFADAGYDPGTNKITGCVLTDTVTTVTNQLSAATISNQVWDTDATGRQTAGTFGQAIGDPGADADTIYGSVVTGAAGANISVDIIALKAETVLILADTDDIGVAGAGLTDLGGMSDGMKAEVEVEVNDGLVALGLDHLISTSVTGTDVADDSIIAFLVDDAATADWDNYDNTTASLEALNVDTDAILVDTSSTIDLINSLGGSTGGSISIQTVLDNTVTDVSINSGEDAVDKSTSPETVGIPVTGHAFVAGQQVTLANTASNDGSFDVDSVSTDEVVIIKSFAAETFGADDTISSTVKTIGFIGSVQAGTVASTEALDGIIHDIDDDGGDDIDLIYTFSVGAGRTATEILFHGFVQGNGDTIDIEVYDHVGTDWEILRTITGANGTNNITLEVPLLLKHTGTTGLDTGRVYVRFDTNATTPSNLSTDQILVEAINTGALSAYENGQIWVNTNANNTNTVADVDGTSRRPVSTIAAAKTLSTSTGLGDFHVINGSSITLAESTANESYFGDNWALALGGQAMAGAHFEGATVSGTQTGTNVNFQHGFIGTATLAADAHLDEVGLNAGTITLAAGAYVFERCYHSGTSLPIIDFAAGNSTLHMHAYHGGFEVQNMDSSDTIDLGGTGRLDINANCSGGVISVRGAWDINDSGSSTIVYDDLQANVTLTLEDTAEIGTAGAGLSNINLPNQTMDIIGDITGNLSGSVGSVTGAVGSVAGNVDGNVTGSIGSLAAQAKTDVNAEVVDVMDTDTITLPGQEAPPLAPTHRQAISWLYKVFRNRKTQTATQWSLLADDESTVDAKATVSDDATTAIKQEVISGA